MKNFLKQNSYYFLALLVYLVAEFIVHPLGNYPLNDDWSYAESVMVFLDSGRISIGEWPAMTLATHILWGALFTKVLGFSFLVLRISTWLSVIIGTWTLYCLGNELSGNRRTSFVLVLCLLFNPIYFNVTNTFMTDVNFLTLLVLGCFLAYRFFSRNDKIALAALLPLSVMLTLLRQYGVILPATVMLCTLLLRDRWKYFLMALVMLGVVYGCLLWYESYLKTSLSDHAAYKFSGNINPTQELFWKNLFSGIANRYRIVITHMFFHTVIFTIAFLPALVRRCGWQTSVIVMVVTAAVVYQQYQDYPLQVGNVFLYSSVGVDTTYETLIGTYQGHPHFYEAGYQDLLEVLKLVFIAVGLGTFVLGLINHYRQRKRGEAGRLYIPGLLLSYVVMILITESFFDRYQIPVIALSLLVYASLLRGLEPDFRMALLPFLFFFYVSTCGTKDYFALNDLKWEAYRDLREKEHVPMERIHGGFEPYMWKDGKPALYYSYENLEDIDYMIQFKPEPGFVVYREMPFQRYLPYKKDTLRVFRLETPAAGSKESP